MIEQADLSVREQLARTVYDSWLCSLKAFIKSEFCFFCVCYLLHFWFCLRIERGQGRLTRRVNDQDFYFLLLSIIRREKGFEIRQSWSAIVADKVASNRSNRRDTNWRLPIAVRRTVWLELLISRIAKFCSLGRSSEPLLNPKAIQTVCTTVNWRHRVSLCTLTGQWDRETSSTQYQLEMK